MNLIHCSSNHARKRSKLLPNSALFSSVSASFGSCWRDAIFLEVKKCWLKALLYSDALLQLGCKLIKSWTMIGKSISNFSISSCVGETNNYLAFLATVIA